MAEEQKSTSDNADQWVSHLIDNARNSNPLVREDLLNRMDQLLKGQISDRLLTQTNLKSVATQLLLDMTPEQPDPEGDYED